VLPGIPANLQSGSDSELSKSSYVPSRLRSCLAPDSLMSAVITCISGSMGTVMLNLPKAYAVYGLGLACVVQTIAGLNTGIASVFLAKLTAKYSNANLYSELVDCVLGPKAKGIFNFFFLVTVAGVMIGMNLTANSFLMNLIEEPMANMFGVEDTPGFNSWGTLISSIIVVTLMIPLQLKNDTSSLKNAGIFSILTLFFVMIVIIIQTPGYMTQNKSMETVEYWNFDSPMKLLQNLGIFIFSYNITTTYHVVKSTMSNPNENRLLKMGFYTVMTLYLPYLSIGILGYLSLGAAGKTLDLFPNRPAIVGSWDILMKIGKVGLVVTIYVAYLMRVIVVKRQFFDFCRMEITPKKNYAFVLSF